MDRLRLLKLLYIADRESLAERGVPIIGGRVAALDNGPLHSDIYELIKGAHEDAVEWQRFLSNDGHVVLWAGDPGRLELSPFEIEKLTQVSDRLRSCDSWEVAELTHKFPEWTECHVAGSSKTIPMERILSSLGFSTADIDQIRNDAESHQRVRKALCT
jgi:uncharacterized phage-associated protein